MINKKTVKVANEAVPEKLKEKKKDIKKRSEADEIG